MIKQWERVHASVRHAVQNGLAATACALVAVLMTALCAAAAHADALGNLRVTLARLQGDAPAAGTLTITQQTREGAEAKHSGCGAAMVVTPRLRSRRGSVTVVTAVFQMTCI